MRAVLSGKAFGSEGVRKPSGVYLVVLVPSFFLGSHDLIMLNLGIKSSGNPAEKGSWAHKVGCLYIVTPGLC